MCDKHAVYNIEGAPPRFCATHKIDGMVDVKNKRCEKCNKQPLYAFDGKKARFCN